jgi:hypothetical protein
VARPQGRQLAVVFYPFGHPTLNACAFSDQKVSFKFLFLFSQFFDPILKRNDDHHVHDPVNLFVGKFHRRKPWGIQGVEDGRRAPVLRAGHPLSGLMVRFQKSRARRVLAIL